MQKYKNPEDITPDAIKRQFAKATEVSFSARAFNHIPYRNIAFGDLGWWLPLTRVLPLVGITPQMLRPVFNPQKRLGERHFPLNRSWFGLNKRMHTVVSVELPATIETYGDLGYFPLSHKPFQELARILGKSVRVLREDGGTGEHYPLFTVHPSGEIVEATTS